MYTTIPTTTCFSSTSRLLQLDFTGSYVLIMLVHACTMQLFYYKNFLIVFYSCIVLKVFCHFALLRFRERQEVSAAEAARFAVEMGLAPVSQIHMLKNLESES